MYIWVTKNKLIITKPIKIIVYLKVPWETESDRTERIYKDLKERGLEQKEFYLEDDGMTIELHFKESISV